MLILLVLLLLWFTYSLRGGCWFSLGSTTLARLVWSVSFAGSYLLLAPTVNWFVFASFIVTPFLALLIPHAYCQNMGRWASPQKRWPSFFMPTLSQEQWVNMPMWQRTGYDAIQMASVGFLRGLIVFVPAALIIQSCPAWPVFTLASLQAVGYVVGWLIPFSIPYGPVEKSSTWGEALNGVAYGVALTLFCL